MTLTPDELDAKLLGYVLHEPRRTLTLGIVTGMAVAFELAERGDLDVLRALGADHALCDRAADLVMLVWMEADRAGGIDPARFAALCDEITRAAGAT